MSTSILQNDGLSSMSWQQVVYNQIVSRKQTELETTSAAIEEKYSNKADLIDAQSERWINVKASINNARLAVDNGQESSSDIKDMLLQMRIIVGNYATSDSKDLLKQQFDDYIDQINRTADSYSKAYNPVGNVVNTDWTPNTISFQTDVAGNETSIQGTYVGSGYAITDSANGTVWVADPGSSTLTEYSNYNTQNEPNSTKTDTGMVSTRGGVVLDAYDASTGDITVTVNPQTDPQQVSGKISFGGLGLMQSWFYDGLDTEEGRQRALDALDHADTLMTMTDSNLASMGSSVESADRRAGEKMDQLSSDRTDVLKSQLIETYQVQIKQQQELQVLQNTFSNMQAQQQAYASIFSGVSKGPFVDVIG